ncbi:MAG: hypothetical protein ACWA47_06825 [Brevirhabdus sp.]
MRVVETRIKVSHFEKNKAGFIGFVTFTHNCPQTGDCGTAHFQCLARVDEDTPQYQIEQAMVADACRQVNFMPEYRLGRKELTFADLEPRQALA